MGRLGLGHAVRAGVMDLVVGLEPAVVLLRVRLLLGLDIRGQVCAHEVVRVALELGRHVLGEEGDLRVVRARARVTLGEG